MIDIVMHAWLDKDYSVPGMHSQISYDSKTTQSMQNPNKVHTAHLSTDSLCPVIHELILPLN